MLQTQKMQKHKYDEESSYCDRETFEDWASRSSVSLHDELPSPSPTSTTPASLLAERDALARALAAERARAAAAARAHDARLAELHGVIAELVRRARGNEGRAIPEEELSDECESTTQPAGELDKDTERTEQNDTSSLSPDGPHEVQALRDAELTTDVSTQNDDRCNPAVVVATASDTEVETNLSDKDSRLCSNARGSPASCRRDRGSSDGRLYTSPGGASSRVAKLASRVKLKRTEDSTPRGSDDEALCSDMLSAQQLAAELCAQAQRSEHIVTAAHDVSSLTASVEWYRSRAALLAAENCTLRHSLQAATDIHHRLTRWCASQESSCVCICGALTAADRALETYDVLLALAETSGVPPEQRAETERVANELLCRLEAAPVLGAPLMSPGPWTHKLGSGPSGWSPDREARLRSHAARLKSDTVTLRNMAPPPALYSHYDSEEAECESAAPNLNMAELEEAVALEELSIVRESRAAARVASVLTEHRAADLAPTHTYTHQSDSTKSRHRKDRHKHKQAWAHAHNETQL